MISGGLATQSMPTRTRSVKCVGFQRIGDGASCRDLVIHVHLLRSKPFHFLLEPHILHLSVDSHICRQQ